MKGDKVKADKKRSGRTKFDTGKPNARKLHTEDAVKEEQDAAEASLNERGGEERLPEESNLEKADTAKDGDVKAESAEEAGSTAKAENTEEADSTAKAENAEEADSTAKAENAEEAGNVAQRPSGESDGQANQTGAEDDGREDEEIDDEEDDDWEEDDDLPDDWEEESGTSKPWVMALVFLGMMFAAAGICVMLWSFTHSDKQEEQNRPTGTGIASGSGDNLPSGAATPGGTGNQSSGNQGEDATSAPNSGQTDTPEQKSDSNKVTTQDGRVIVFTDCDDMVTPKEYVNLRTEPSTSRGEATVGCRLNQGESAHRTGISEEMGWSRVEYDGQVLYVVTSYVNVVTDGGTTE